MLHLVHLTSLGITEEETYDEHDHRTDRQAPGAFQAARDGRADSALVYATPQLREPDPDVSQASVTAHRGPGRRRRRPRGGARPGAPGRRDRPSRAVSGDRA